MEAESEAKKKKSVLRKMPKFGVKKSAKEAKPKDTGNTGESPMAKNTPNMNGAAADTPEAPTSRPRPKLVFHCQQAHGSPTGVISGFTNVKELYQKIAECYDMDPSEILFCTLNTHKIDMTRLLGGQIGLEDFIFAHIKGRPKEAELHKEEDALGLTITDNGAGYAFIKRIKEGSIMDQIDGICVGDHIEKINNKSMVGCRHFEVAKTLKEIPRGETFLLRVVSPNSSGFASVGLPGARTSSKSMGSGKETLRIHANTKQSATVEVSDDIVTVAVDKINGLLESFMGINDTDLSQTIWEIGSSKDNPHNFAVAIDESELGEFGFTDDFIFDLWGAINDAKHGRLQQTPQVQEFKQTF